MGDAQARASLRNALPAIKKQLGPERLSVDRETVALDMARLWVDALEFRAQAEALLAAGLPNPASIEMDLYRGDLLSDFYDEWIAPEREGLRHLYLKALLRLAHGWQAPGEYRRALHWVEVLLAAESASEAAYQLQIACYLALGDSEAALRQYEACERALRDELGIEPAAETRALYTRLRQPPTRPQPAAALGNLPLPLTSFIGRQAAVAAVRSLLEGGHGCSRSPGRAAAARRGWPSRWRPKWRPAWRRAPGGWS